ncbi:hypothetical protein AB0L85_31395 [Streptomyces sp. NPDC052051]
MRISDADLRWHVYVARSRERPANAAMLAFEAMLTQRGATTEK